MRNSRIERRRVWIGLIVHRSSITTTMKTSTRKQSVPGSENPPPCVWLWRASAVNQINITCRILQDASISDGLKSFPYKWIHFLLHFFPITCRFYLIFFRVFFYFVLSSSRFTHLDIPLIGSSPGGEVLLNTQRSSPAYRNHHCLSAWNIDCRDGNSTRV